MIASNANEVRLGRPKRVGRALRAFIKARAGASAVEFALLSPFFFACLFMMIQASLILFQQHLLDSATKEAIRSLVLGNVQSAGTTTAADFKKNFICPQLSGLFDCNRVIADLRVTPEGSPNFNTSWNNIPVTRQDLARYCVGSAGEYMYLRIAYPMPLLGLGLLPASIFSNFEGMQVAMLESFGALRVEPVAVNRVGQC